MACKLTSYAAGCYVYVLLTHMFSNTIYVFWIGMSLKDKEMIGMLRTTYRHMVFEWHLNINVPVNSNLTNISFYLIKPADCKHDCFQGQTRLPSDSLSDGSSTGSSWVDWRKCATVFIIWIWQIPNNY